MQWRKSEIKELKLELRGSLNIRKDDLVERMSNRLGMDMDSIREKISEIKRTDRIRKLAGKIKSK